MRVRFLLFSIERANDINNRFVCIGEQLSKFFFSLKFDLAKADLHISPEKYLTAAFFSAMVYGLGFFGLLYGLFLIKDANVTMQNFFLSILIGFASFFAFFFIHAIYPGLIAKKYAASIDQSLLFALKSMLIQVTSGVSLFDSMVNVSKAGYGAVSKEFENVTQEISAGESETKAIEKLALKTKSDYLRRTSWQLLSSIRSGASLQGALSSVVETLVARQLREIRNYAAELNMWILLYLLLAAAIPTLGITFLVILSAMGGSSVGQEHIMLMIGVAFVMQIALIGFVKTRIPKGFL